MIFKVDCDKKLNLKDMFKEFHCTLVLSYLQGHMGTAWVDDLENPKVARIEVGIFDFFAGDSQSKEAEELLKGLPEHSLVIVQTEDWKRKIESLYEGAEKFSRYDFNKDWNCFDREKLKSIVSNIPTGYELKRIDEKICKNPSLHEVSPDFISQFNSIEDYLKRGVGYCITENDVVVSGATSFSIYNGGIEIEVGTDKEHRRKGLAQIVSAALILECLEKGIYPNWDAANLWSVELAKKLGYVYKEAYDTYYINNKKYR